MKPVRHELGRWNNYETGQSEVDRELGMEFETGLFYSAFDN